jgi:NADP-dependent 3-hydroxy acid dehydrogenase YdfG
MSSSGVSLPRFDLSGKWALITGGAGLLGKEHALALLEVGANVVLWDIDSENLIKVTILNFPIPLFLKVINIRNCEFELSEIDNKLYELK